MRLSIDEPGAERSSLEGLGNYLRNRRKVIVSSLSGETPGRRRRVAWRAVTSLSKSNAGPPLVSGLVATPGTIATMTQGGPLAAVDFAISELRESAAVRYDVFGSPLCWNATADGLFRWSSDASAFSRNAVIAGLTNDYYREFLGTAFESVFRSTVRRFRHAYQTGISAALARRVYEFAVEHSAFRAIWDDVASAHDETTPGPLVLVVPEVGTLRLDRSDVAPLRRSDCFIRFLTPHDVESRRKLAVLAHMGKSSKFVDDER